MLQFLQRPACSIVVTYDRERTEGLTAEDMVEAISATYGIPMSPVTRSTVVGPSRDASASSAYWEDSHCSLSLFQSSYLSAFGLVVVSSDWIRCAGRDGRSDAAR